MDNVHFEEALEAQAAQREVAFGTIVVGALLDGNSAGGAVSIGLVHGQVAKVAESLRIANGFVNARANV